MAQHTGLSQQCAPRSLVNAAGLHHETLNRTYNSTLNHTQPAQTCKQDAPGGPVSAARLWPGGACSAAVPQVRVRPVVEACEKRLTEADSKDRAALALRKTVITCGHSTCCKSADGF